MRITPLDIRKQEFRKAMRGLDAEEVYAFLSTVGDEYEAVLNDNKALRERLLELDDKVQEYRKMEKTLRDTLLTAERVTVEAKDNARREANLIIKEAQIEADRSLRDIKGEAMKLRQAVSQLRSQRESYLGRMKVIAESLLKFIESVEVDFDKEDDAYQDQFPPEGQAKPAAPAEGRAENSDLFNRPPGGSQRGKASASMGNRGARPSPEQPFESAGPPSDAKRVDAGGAGETQWGRVEDPERPGASEDARNEAGADPSPEDIGSIIERMADAPTEVGEPSGQRPAPPAAGATPKSRQFDPVSAAPAGPIATGDPVEDPPQTLEASAEGPGPVGRRSGGRRTPPPPREPAANPSWERSPETAIAVDQQERSDDVAGQKAADAKITSEISLDQIRRDLERRMAEERNRG